MLTRFPMRARRAVLRTLTLALLGAGAVACSVSPQQEAQIGADYASQINQQLPIVNDAQVNSYINRLGSRIAARTERNFNYRFFVVNTDQVNAFAVPGGYVYVNRGLIDRTDNLSELAGVLAHEIAHVDLRHSAEQIERAQGANIGLTLAYVLLGRAPSGVERTGINLAGSAVFARFGREAEQEADAQAVELLVASGIHPNGLVSFFGELLEERKRRPTTVEQWFSTHPLTEERIAETRAMIQRVPAARLRGLQTNTTDYAAFKSRVRRLPEAPRTAR